MLLFIGNLGVPELLAIFVLALLIFGPAKLPDIGRSIGKGLREFKKATSGIMDSVNEGINQPEPSPQKPAALTAAMPLQTAKHPRDQEEIVVDLESEGKKAP